MMILIIQLFGSIGKTFSVWCFSLILSSYTAYFSQSIGNSVKHWQTVFAKELLKKIVISIFYVQKENVRGGYLIILCILGPQRDQACLLGFLHNKGTDQPAQSHILISSFFIHVLEINSYKLATSEVSFFQLVFVAEETGLSVV